MPVVSSNDVERACCDLAVESSNWPTGIGVEARSNATPLSDDIDAVENLLLLCGDHHRIVDNNPRIYSVEVLAKYKADHEAKMAPKKLRSAPPPLETDTVDLSLLQRLCRTRLANNLR